MFQEQPEFVPIHCLIAVHGPVGKKGKTKSGSDQHEAHEDHRRAEGTRYGGRKHYIRLLSLGPALANSPEQSRRIAVRPRPAVARNSGGSGTRSAVHRELAEETL